MSIVRDFMDTDSYMIVTERGYFIAHDCLKNEVEKAIEAFKTEFHFNFNTVIDIIKNPYEELEKENDMIDLLYNKGELDDDNCDKECDKIFDRYADINRNAILMIHLGSQME
jgi:hypothetical protein